MNTPKVNKIQYKENFTYYIQFEDKLSGEVDFKTFLWGKAFEELKEQSYFKKASIDDITGTISWPNGVDIAPETLYEKISSQKENFNQA